MNKDSIPQNPSPQLGGAGGGHGAGKRHGGKLLWLSLVFVALLVYLLIDPSEVTWMPHCPLYTLTHVQCPFCGAQRMAHSLLNGNLAAAWHHNAALLLALPYILFIIVGQMSTGRLRQISDRLLTNRALALYMLLATGWMVVRNLT